MSHFDDLDFDPPGPNAPGIVVVVFGVLLVAGIIWAILADRASAEVCKENGEEYFDSNMYYTLCKNDAGVVTKR